MKYSNVTQIYLTKTKKTTPKWKFITSNNIRKQKINSNPGPGTYKLDSIVGEGPKHIMGCKLIPITKVDNELGPGAYNACFRTVEASSLKPGIGIGSKFQISDHKKVPGPGAYNIKSKIVEGPKYG
jgi:hypothetical protein